MNGPVHSGEMLLTSPCLDARVRALFRLEAALGLSRCSAILDRIVLRCGSRHRLDLP